jgi:uncharacterized membrane protein
MTVRPEFWVVLGALAAASLVCRFGGFWLMRYVPITPRLEAALKATPLAVMAGIVAPSVIQGSWPEWLGLAATACVMRIGGNDLVAAVVGVAVVAVVRSGQLAA